MSSSRRNALILALVAAVSAYLFYRNDSFWGLVTAAVVVVWSLIGALPMMDGFWRTKVGFVVATFFFALVALTPTVTPILDAHTGGKFSANRVVKYIDDNISFGIAPGLDLRGGVRLVYTVEVEDAIADKRNNFAEEMRLELATIFKVHTGDGRMTRDELAKLETIVHVATPESAVIKLKFANAADRSKVDERFLKKFQQELAPQMGPGDNEVTFKIRGEVESSIRERAVAQAKETVQRIIEVPGLDKKSFDEIKDLISRTARLEFKMVDDDADFFAKIKDKDLPEGEGISILEENAPDGIGPDGAKKNVRNHYAQMSLREGETMEACLQRFKKWVATLSVPDDRQIGYEAISHFDPDTGKTTDEGWHTVYLFKRAELTGDYITDASVGQDQQSGLGQYYVALTFSPAGADRFEEVTGANVNRYFAIILDDVIDSTPVIKTKIGGGHATITMGAGDPEQQVAQARRLELVLRSGALPAQITPSNSSEIGPSLGRDSIDQAVKGLVVSAGLVLVFMIFYYRKAGVVADAAVLFNLMLQMAILATLSATMTLPGIAGLALTIGMGVDANVLVNERIREELRAGRSVRAAVENGYHRAFPSIIDGHITVFISGLILSQYGTGPVKGFAYTLLVGIAASLFTGFFCTRLVFEWWTRGAKVKRLSVGAEF
jgi:preprotein translocase subunit SecD